MLEVGAVMSSWSTCGSVSLSVYLIVPDERELAHLDGKQLDGKRLDTPDDSCNCARVLDDQLEVDRASYLERMLRRVVAAALLDICTCYIAWSTAFQQGLALIRHRRRVEDWRQLEN